MLFELLGLVAVVFAGALVTRILMLKWRKRSLRVNCWWCSEDSMVPADSANRWWCCRCEQYNGFDEKTGDYNRDMVEFRTPVRQKFTMTKPSPPPDPMNWTDLPGNGLCRKCNDAQGKKVRMLANFEPRVEENYDMELSAFKHQLDSIYELCYLCVPAVEQKLDEQTLSLGLNRAVTMCFSAASTPGNASILSAQGPSLARRSPVRRPSPIQVAELSPNLGIRNRFAENTRTLSWLDKKSEQKFTKVRDGTTPSRELAPRLDSLSLGVGNDIPASRTGYRNCGSDVEPMMTDECPPFTNIFQTGPTPKFAAVNAASMQERVTFRPSVFQRSSPQSIKTCIVGGPQNRSPQSKMRELTRPSCKSEYNFSLDNHSRQSENNVGFL